MYKNSVYAWTDKAFLIQNSVRTLNSWQMAVQSSYHTKPVASMILMHYQRELRVIFCGYGLVNMISWTRRISFST